MIKTLGISLAVATVLSMSGCSSDNNDTTTPPSGEKTVQTGTFIDSAVQGIGYSTPTQSGVTDENGSFKYKDGETVTFKIGGIKLGKTKGLSTLTPQELAGVTVVENSKAQDILILFQTLDADHNASNGIEINEATRSASNSMNIDFTEDTIDINSIIRLLS